MKNTRLILSCDWRPSPDGRGGVIYDPVFVLYDRQLERRFETEIEIAIEPRANGLEDQSKVWFKVQEAEHDYGVCVGYTPSPSGGCKVSERFLGELRYCERGELVREIERLRVQECDLIAKIERLHVQAVRLQDLVTSLQKQSEAIAELAHAQQEHPVRETK